MPASIGGDPLRIADVRFTDKQVQLQLAGGKVVAGGLQRYNLLSASPEQRANWTLSEDGCHAVWPGLGSTGRGIRLHAHEVAWEEICERALAQLKDAQWKVEALGPRQRDIVALWRLEADGYNGGFMQFFCNWGEANCALALAALRTINAQATCDLVSRQRAVLDRLEDHPEMKSYQDIYGLLTEEELRLISEELDPKLWEAAEEIPPLAARYYFDTL